MKHAVPFLFLFILGCAPREPDPYDLDFDIPRTEDFAPSLSFYGLYDGPLEPTEQAIPLELSSDLFTDYAKKQRLMLIPDGTTITRTNTTLEYPEGTILSKTFYYPFDMRDKEGDAHVIETRLLVKTDGIWNLATYLWNESQTDASLLLEGTTTPVSWIAEDGSSRSTEYAVPHEGECVTCHQVEGVTALIGPRLRNLNRVVTRDGAEVGQLDFLESRGVLAAGEWSSAPVIPNYDDETLPMEDRARAYLDMNCAHCHNPDGWDEVSGRNFDFRYSVSLEKSGIENKARDIKRVLENDRMPYLGTTIRHDEGVDLVLEYVSSF